MDGETAAVATRIRTAVGRRPARRRVFVRELTGLLALAGPIIISQLGQVGMNTADTIMVGPLGATPLAAVGLGSAIHFIGIVFTVGVIIGLTPLVSQAWGAGDRARCRAVFVQGLWVGLLLSVPVIAMNLAGAPIARALGQDEAVAGLAGAYMVALAPGVPAWFLFTAARQYLEGMGRPTAPMVVTFLGLAINIAANRVLIYGIEGWVPAYGVVGSGMATTVVRWSMLAAIGIWVLAHAELRPFDAPARPHPATLSRIVTLGVPIGLAFTLEVGLFSFAAVMMGWLGPLELAAHQVTINIAATTFMVALGVSLAGSIRVGHHIGARRGGAVRRAVLATYLLALAFMAVCALLFVLVPEGLIRLYTRDPLIVALGARLLLVAALFQLFDGGQVAGVSVLRGAADTRTPMLLAAIGYWGFGLPIAWLLAFRTGLGAVGVWLGLSAGLFATAVLLLFRVRGTFWRTPVRRLEAGTPAA